VLSIALTLRLSAPRSMRLRGSRHCASPWAAGSLSPTCSQLRSETERGWNHWARMRSAGCASPKRFLHYGSKKAMLFGLGRGSDVAAPVRGAASAGVIMSAPVITLIGGPTTLIEANGFRLLTDPTFDAPGEYKLPHVTLKKLTGPARTADQ